MEYTTITIKVPVGSTNMVKVAPTTALSSGQYEFDNGGANNGRLQITAVRPTTIQPSKK